MDTLLFISAIVCLALVVVWYVVNEASGASGEKGFLAIAPDKRDAKAPSYRMKNRATRGVLAAEPEEAPAPKFTERTGGFRDKSRDGYKPTGPLPRFGERATKRPSDKAES